LSSINRNDVLSTPHDIGRRIVETGAVTACPVLSTHQFINFCAKRDTRVDAKRLERLERFGIFMPLFRVKVPSDDAPLFRIPVTAGDNWFTTGQAWDTTRSKKSKKPRSDVAGADEAYYSIFQIYDLTRILPSLTLGVHLDQYLEDDGYDFHADGERWREIARNIAAAHRGGSLLRATAFLCQYISEKYYPLTRTDQRTFQPSYSVYSDKCISVRQDPRNWQDCPPSAPMAQI
jgi:hypothetical protein